MTTSNPRSSALPAAFAALLVADVAGGLLDIRAGRSTPATAWGPKATLCAPLPMVVFQAGAVAAIRRGSGTTARAAAALLALACAVSIASGFFDGQLAKGGLHRAEVAYQVGLLALTGVVGVLGATTLRR